MSESFEDKTTILKVVVGSRAHGLADENSDYDYRGVFVVPTSRVLSLSGITSSTSFIEGKEDDTSWEIGKFLMMAIKCNPSVLEAFKSPWVVNEWSKVPRFDDGSHIGEELKKLFPYVWNSVDVRNAFIGYGLNQRKKFLDNKDNRAKKYACSHLRTLYNAYNLLITGDFQMSVKNTPIEKLLTVWKEASPMEIQEFHYGNILQTVARYEKMVEEAYEKNPHKKTDFARVDEFLLKVRRHFL